MTIQEVIIEEVRKTKETGREVDGARVVINTFDLAELLDDQLETPYGWVSIGVDETVPLGEAWIVKTGDRRI